MSKEEIENRIKLLTFIRNVLKKHGFDSVKFEKNDEDNLFLAETETRFKPYYVKVQYDINEDLKPYYIKIENCSNIKRSSRDCDLEYDNDIKYFIDYIERDKELKVYINDWQRR